MVTATRETQAAETTIGLLDDLFGDGPVRDFGVRLWDGTEWGAPAQERRFTIVLMHPGSLRAMFLPPTELALGEAFIYGDFDVEGDLEGAMALGRSLERFGAEPAAAARVGAQLLRLPARGREHDGHERASLRGGAHTKAREVIPKILKHWGTVGGVCDATGIGEPLAYYLVEYFKGKMEIEPYKFKATGDENKSKLGYLAYTFCMGDLIKIPARPLQDLQQLELWREVKWQLEQLIRVAKKQQQINWYVPSNAEPRKPGNVPHDDLATVVFLLLRAAQYIKDPNRRAASALDRSKHTGM
jgi:hypothetical protein